MKPPHSAAAILSTFVFALLSCLGCAAEQHERTLLFGGPIYTGDPNHPTVEAIVIEGNRVRFAGDLAQARALAQAGVTIDLHGHAAYPGFVDAHEHLYDLGEWSAALDLTDAGSIADLVRRLGDHARRSEAAVIEGYGWIETPWPEHRMLRTFDLDVVADRPSF